jgi:PD-(D/E)XK nuclease superfamily
MATEVPPPSIRPEHRVVLIKIARSAPMDRDAAALLEATSKWWVVSESRRGGGPASPEYALAVSRGRVVAAYRIDRWQKAPSGPRWGFVGELAEDLTALYRGADVTTYFPPGAANPLRYVNCVATTAAVGAPRESTARVVEVKRTELDETVKRLKAEPLTHLMLGHRELFHSNILAWFFECMPESADEVFGSLTRTSPRTSTVRTVRREKKNLDLWFAWPGRCPLVIENKVFSLPDEAQLASYGESARAGGEDPTLSLLSLSNPSWPDDRKVIAGHEWHWLSYPDLAERIRSALPPECASYECQTMRHYSHVVDLLSDLVSRVVVTDPKETIQLPLDVEGALGDDRLASVMAKLRAHSVANCVALALRDAGFGQAEVGSGLTHAQSLVEWFIGVERAPEARAGWQLQEDQFRLALIAPHLKGTQPEQRQARFEFAKANEDLFDFAAIDDILGTSAAPLMPILRASSHGFNRFDPDFVYRYKQAPDLTVAQLEAAAVAIARRMGAR